MPISFLKKIKLRKSLGLLSLYKEDLRPKSFSGKHLVGAYIFSCSDLKASQSLFSDGFPSVILMPHKNDEVRLRTEAGLEQLKSAWVCCGVIQNIQWQVPPGLEYIIVLRFKPSSFYSIFNVDPLIFKDKPVCSLEDIVQDDWKERIDEMYELVDAEQRLAYLQKNLSAYNTHGYLPYILEKAIDHIEARKGNTSVSELIEQLGDNVNQKWLHRNFVKFVGISPKKYISLQRFIYTYGQYDNKPQKLLGIAMSNGYYDYNHFLKDFKQYIGVAPSRYRWEL